jgi:inositol hexakisphosphate/diphosphoinositol-pentakisphosphate kinase
MFNVLLDLAVESWPRCDFLIAFYSNGFPLDKAIDYVKLRQPYCINDLILQEALKDRRLVLRILDAHNIPTAPRIVVSRDGGPKMSAELAERLKHINDACYLPRPREPSTKSDVSSSETANTARGLIALESSDAEQRAQVPDTPDTFAQIDENTIRQGIYTLSKPFVEKPVDGDNHNIYIYYRTEDGGGARQLFRKVSLGGVITAANSSLIHIYGCV